MKATGITKKGLHPKGKTMFEGILQPTHLILILVLVLIVFGPGKLPSLGRALGQSIHELRSATAQTGETPSSEKPESK